MTVPVLIPPEPPPPPPLTGWRHAYFVVNVAL